MDGDDDIAFVADADDEIVVVAAPFLVFPFAPFFLNPKA